MARNQAKKKSLQAKKRFAYQRLKIEKEILGNEKNKDYIQ